MDELDPFEEALFPRPDARRGEPRRVEQHAGKLGPERERRGFIGEPACYLADT